MGKKVKRMISNPMVMMSQDKPERLPQIKKSKKLDELFKRKGRP